MTAVRYFLWLLVAWTLVPALPVSAQTFPPLTGRVVDAANLLDPAQEARLTGLSNGIEQASGRQLVVATVPDLQGYEIEEFGYRLGRAWKIGQSEADNGIILLVAPNERRVRIEVGYGLEPIMTDALSRRIIDTAILPRFKAGDMPGGIVAGAEAIGEQMRLPLEAAEARAKAQLDARPTGRSGNRVDGGDLFMAIFWIAVVLIVVLPMLRGRGGRRGKRYRGGIAPVILWGPGWGGGGSSWGGGGGFGGGSFGGGGASGGW